MATKPQPGEYWVAHRINPARVETDDTTTVIHVTDFGAVLEFFDDVASDAAEFRFIRRINMKAHA